MEQNGKFRNTYIHDQLILDKNAKAIQWRKYHLLANGVGTMNIYIKKKKKRTEP